MINQPDPNLSITICTETKQLSCSATDVYEFGASQVWPTFLGIIDLFKYLIKLKI